MKKTLRKILLPLALLLVVLISACAATGAVDKNSTFSILFLDVGPGDAALVECDGHYMLIDGGDSSAGEIVYGALKERDIRQLDILAISHLHADHIGGLPRALAYATSVGRTICNANYSDKQVFRNLEHELAINDSKITVPATGESLMLGSATIEVIDASAEEENDSLVLLITYGDTRFLFTGDIESTAQTRISDLYENESDSPFEVDLIKMPHHGSYTGTLYRFLRTFMPDYAVISVGADNPYGHPSRNTMELLENPNLGATVYRTDQVGDILVRSNGKKLSVTTTG